MKKPSRIIGIDEAGRGPLAGPVAVAAVAGPVHFDFSTYAGLTDSKKLSAAKRERLFGQLRQDEALEFTYASTRAKTIDQIGINPSIKRALARCLRKLAPMGESEESMTVLLDGGLEAPRRFKNQETVVRGDEKEPIISLASVAAKVRRDERVRQFDARYPKYNFASHKGYGTKQHRAVIREFGPTDIHRHSFLSNITS